MKKATRMVRKSMLNSKNQNCNIMVVVVVVLIIIGLVCLARKNNWLNNNKEGFTSSELNNLTEKPNPGPNEVVFVFFFVEWCPHCKSVKDEWKKLVKLNNTEINGKKVKVEACNCEASEAEKEAAQDNNVEGYPTIKLISNSAKVDYNGARDADSMEKFIRDYCKEN
jgi:thiol-disulfide isomerase/thioredoxin